MADDFEPRQRDVDRPIHQVRADGQIVGEIRFDTPVFVISVAAELAGMHAQTLRSYDRDGLVSPGRTQGGGRRYSQRDIELLQQVQELSQDDGVNRAGIRRIMELETQVDALRDKIAELAGELDSVQGALAVARGDEPGGGEARAADTRAHEGREAPGPGSAIVAVRGAVVPFQVRTTAVVSFRSVADGEPPEDDVGDDQREGAPDRARENADGASDEGLR